MRIVPQEATRSGGQGREGGWGLLNWVAYLESHRWQCISPFVTEHTVPAGCHKGKGGGGRGPFFSFVVGNLVTQSQSLALLCVPCMHTALYSKKKKRGQVMHTVQQYRDCVLSSTWWLLYIGDCRKRHGSSIEYCTAVKAPDKSCVDMLTMDRMATRLGAGTVKPTRRAARLVACTHTCVRVCVGQRPPRTKAWTN